MSQRQRCAGRGCQHSRSAHDHNGDCVWCMNRGSCRGWASRRRHLWRELCWDTWFLAHHTWMLRREEAAVGYPTEEREFADEHPQPTLKETLIGLAGSTGGPRWT